MARTVNPFKALGLQPATVKDLGLEGALALAKVTFRQLSSVYHPDRGGSPAKFDIVSEANTLLSNPADAKEFYDEFVSSQAAKREATIADLRLEHQEDLFAWRKALGQALLAPNVPGSVPNPTPGLRVLVRVGSTLQELTFSEAGETLTLALAMSDDQEITPVVEGGVSATYYSDGDYLRRCTPSFREGGEEEGHRVRTDFPEGWYRFGPGYKEDGTAKDQQLMRALEPLGSPKQLFKRPLVLLTGVMGDYSMTKTSQLALEPGGGVSANLDNIEISEAVGNPALLSQQWQSGAMLLTVARDLQVGMFGQIIGIMPAD